MKRERLPQEVAAALETAARGPGWNMRSRAVQRFTLPGRYGTPCVLFVVPAAAWAYRRRANQVAHWNKPTGGEAIR